MAGTSIVPVAKRALWAVVLLIALSQIIKGERLPIKTYTTADGLAHNVVNRVMRGSRGFLWFCTREGLSRFDCYSFTNYGIEQGLPAAVVEDLLETREGLYWVATAGGLCRFNPPGSSQAIVNNRPPTTGHRPMRCSPFSLLVKTQDRSMSHHFWQDHTGALWCGTRNGLYRVETAADEAKLTFIDLGIPDYLESRFIDCLLFRQPMAVIFDFAHTPSLTA